MTAKSAFKIVGLFVGQFIPSLEKSQSLADHLKKKMPPEFFFQKKHYFESRKRTQKKWSMEVGAKSDASVPTWIVVAFIDNIGLDSQTYDKSKIGQKLITHAVSSLRCESIPENPSTLITQETIIKKTL